MSEPQVGAEAGGIRAPTSGGHSPREQAAEAAHLVKEEAASFAEDARAKAAEKVESEKQTATRTLADFAHAMRKAGFELDQADQTMATRMVRQAADGLETFARSVSDKRPEELLDAVRDFGRRNPTAFIAGSVLAGIAIGRFLKSSSATPEPERGDANLTASPAAGVFEERSSAPDAADYDPMLDPGGFVDPTAAGATSVGAPDEDDLTTPRADGRGGSGLGG